MIRQRLSFLIALFVVGGLGYWLRFSALVSPWLQDRSGGAAYVMFWMCAVAVLHPAVNVFKLAAAILTITCGLEFLQLYHPPWLETLRRSFLGRVILGTTFDWNDFPPYAVGSVLGSIMLKTIKSGSAGAP